MSLFNPTLSSNIVYELMSWFIYMISIVYAKHPLSTVSINLLIFSLRKWNYNITVWGLYIMKKVLFPNIQTNTHGSLQCIFGRFLKCQVKICLNGHRKTHN